MGGGGLYYLPPLPPYTPEIHPCTLRIIQMLLQPLYCCSHSKSIKLKVITITTFLLLPPFLTCIVLKPSFIQLFLVNLDILLFLCVSPFFLYFTSIRFCIFLGFQKKKNLFLFPFSFYHLFSFAFFLSVSVYIYLPFLYVLT